MEGSLGGTLLHASEGSRPLRHLYQQSATVPALLQPAPRSPCNLSRGAGSGGVLWVHVLSGQAEPPQFVLEHELELPSVPLRELPAHVSRAFRTLFLMPIKSSRITPLPVSLSSPAIEVVRLCMKSLALFFPYFYTSSEVFGFCLDSLWSPLLRFVSPVDVV